MHAQMSNAITCLPVGGLFIDGKASISESRLLQPHRARVRPSDRRGDLNTRHIPCISNELLMRTTAILSFAMYLLAQNAQGQCSCWIQPDTSYTVIDNTSMWNASGFQNADDGSYGPIVLPFNIHFWGQDTNTVYINVNGNVTLDTWL